uniref:Secreted protein n=1 Tax=Caenorhabditis japonica TaxID=281687 RepID=A0A8R1EID0_CAEJA
MRFFQVVLLVVLISVIVALPFFNSPTSSNNKEYRITPVGSKDVAISRNTEAPKKDKPFVQFAPAPADALAAFAFVPPAGTLTTTMSVFFGTPLKK